MRYHSANSPILVPRRGLEPRSPGPEPGVLPLNEREIAAGLRGDRRVSNPLSPESQSGTSSSSASATPKPCYNSSSVCSPPTKLLTCFDAMTVAASDIALRDLGNHSLHRVSLRHHRHMNVFFSTVAVIKFQNPKVIFAAVHTGVCFKIRLDIFLAFPLAPPVYIGSPSDAEITVSGIVFCRCSTLTLNGLHIPHFQMWSRMSVPPRRPAVYETAALLAELIRHFNASKMRLNSSPKLGDFEKSPIFGNWWGRRDLNPQAIWRRALDPLRLPISPHPHEMVACPGLEPGWPFGRSLLRRVRLHFTSRPNHGGRRENLHSHRSEDRPLYRRVGSLVPSPPETEIHNWKNKKAPETERSQTLKTWRRVQGSNP